MDITDITFNAKIEAAKEVIAVTGNDAGLGEKIAEWAIANYGRDYWGWCAERLLCVGDGYTVIRERMGECGIYG